MLSVTLIALTLAAQPGPTPSPPPPSARAEAYQAFLEGRRLGSAGDATAAIAALERAATLDGSPVILSELAQLYARQDRPADARRAAERALAIDGSQADAHWILGMLSLPTSAMQGGDAAPSRDMAAIEQAIGHLEKARAGRTFDLSIPVMLGRLYMQTNRAAQAVAVLSPVVERDQGAVDAGVLLAQALDRTGEHARALAVISQVLAGEPRFFRARLVQAELLEKARRWVEAAEAYALAARENPTAPELRVRQAAALLSAERPEDARAVLTDVITQHPGDLQAKYLLAQAQRELGDQAGAEQTARTLMTLAPGDVRGPVVLSQVFADRREHAKVVDVLTPLVAGKELASSPSALGLTLRLVNAHLALGQSAAAVAVLEQARATRPDPMLDAYLLQTLVLARRFEQAVTLGEQVRAARPDDPQPARLLAQALTGAGRGAEAVSLLEAERGKRPDDPAVVLALATTLADLDRQAQALQVLHESEAAFGGQVVYWFQRGTLLERMRRRTDAEAAFRKALALDPRHAPTLNYLGYMYAEDGTRLDEAVQLIQQALAQDPDNGSYLDSLGWAYFKQGKLTEAREHLQKAADQLRTNSVIQDHLGDVLDALRESDAAVAAWERALAGDGDAIDRSSIQGKIQRARRR